MCGPNGPSKDWNYILTPAKPEEVDELYRQVMGIETAQAAAQRREAAEARDKKVAAQIDGHYCHDWDGLAVSALTPEYDGCVDFKKTRRGKIMNWFWMRKFYWGDPSVRWYQILRG